MGVGLVEQVLAPPVPVGIQHRGPPGHRPAQFQPGEPLAGLFRPLVEERVVLLRTGILTKPPRVGFAEQVHVFQLRVRLDTELEIAVGKVDPLLFTVAGVTADRGRFGTVQVNETACANLAEIGQDVSQDVAGGEGGVAAKELLGVSLVKPLVDLGDRHLFPVVTVEDPRHVGREPDAFDAVLAAEVQAVEFGPGVEIGSPLVGRQAEDLGFDSLVAIDRDAGSCPDDTLPARVGQEPRGVAGFWMNPGRWWWKNASSGPGFDHVGGHHQAAPAEGPATVLTSFQPNKDPAGAVELRVLGKLEYEVGVSGRIRGRNGDLFVLERPGMRDRNREPCRAWLVVFDRTPSENDVRIGSSGRGRDPVGAPATVGTDQVDGAVTAVAIKVTKDLESFVGRTGDPHHVLEDLCFSWAVPVVDPDDLR